MDFQGLMLNRLRKWLWNDNYISPEERAIEILEKQLILVNEEKKQLLETILKLAEPPKEVVEVKQPVNYQPINKFVPWHVRQQMLEKEDAKKHELELAAKKEQEEIEKLEKAIELEDATESGTK